MRFEITTVCTLTCTLSYTIPKTADRLILRPISRDLPGSASTGETPRRKISKVVAPRDTKQVFGRVCRQEDSNIKTYHTTPYHKEYSISSSFSSVDVTRPVLTR